MSTPNISIQGTANFNDETVNNGVIATANFTDSAANGPTAEVATATFSVSSINQGVVSTSATFNDTAVNSSTGSVAVASFNGTAVNEGTVSESAVFNDSAANAPTASVAVATFNDGATNQGTVSLSAFFNDTAVNSSTASVAVAVFTADTVNEGVVTGNAVFEGNASNSATGVIQGDAIFADTTSNEGSVTGDAQIAATATSNGSVGGTATMYQHPYQYNNYWADDSTLTIGSTILYTGQYTRILAINANFVIGTDGFVGFGTATTGINGIVATISLVDHAYQDNSLAYYFDNASLSSGDIVYTGQYTNDVAANVSFYIGTDGQQGYASVATNGSGAATITLVEHTEHDGSFTYWWDTSPLADGATIYTGAYTDSVAANASFNITGYSVATDSSGIATLTPVSNWYDDASSAAHTITLSGTITQSDEGGGVLAAAFDGGNNYMTTVATGSEFDFTSGDATIEFWFYPTSSAFQYLLLGEGILNVGTLSVHLWPGNQMTVNDGVNTDDYFGISLNEWQHLAIVISSGSRDVYLNGSLVATSTQLLGATTTLYIGAPNGYNSSANYNGKIAGLRIVKGSAIYTSDFAVPATPLTDVTGTELLLNFEASAVPIVAPAIITHPQDVVDANLNGVFSITATGTTLEYQWQYSQDNGSTWYNLNSPQFGSNTDTWNEQGQPVNDQLFRCRVSNSAGTVYSNVAKISRVDWYDDASSAGIVTLNGDVTQVDEGNGVIVADFNNGYLSVRDLASLATGDFTLEYFIKYDSAGVGYQPGVTLYTPNAGDANATISSYIENANYFNVLMANSSGNGWQTYVPGTNAGTQVAPIGNQWNHVAVTRTGNTLALYLNGTLIGTNSITESVYDVDRVLEIGRYTAFPGGSLSLYGRIAALRIVRGTALYSGSSITIPTTLPTAVTGTELLLNFGANAVPSVSVVDVNKNGAYSDGYYASGVIDTTYNNASPTDTIDAGYYTYVSGIGYVANGSYSNGRYNNGSYDSSYSSSTPTAAIDNANQYYVYSSGSPSVAHGAYSNGYYDSGTLNSGYTNATPQLIQDVANTYHTYSNGSGSLAQGYYSNGYFSGGLVMSVTDVATAIDTNLMYAYNGFAVGLYTGTYSGNGLHYVSGVPANGYYSTGYYSSGQLNYNAVTTPVQTADTNKWVTYSQGVPTYATGTQQAANGSWYSFDGNGGGVFVSVSITDENSTFYRYDGLGGRSRVYANLSNNNLWYYFNSSTVGIGSIGYYANGNPIGYSSVLFGDLLYDFDISNNGEVISITDTDPYN